MTVWPKAGLHAAESRQYDEISETFVQTLERDPVNITQLLDAAVVYGLIVGQFDCNNESHSDQRLG